MNLDVINKGNKRGDFYITSYTADNIRIPLYDVTNSNHGIKISVIIGPNASGKSTVVANLLDELTYLYELINSNKSEPYYSKRRLTHNSASVEYYYSGNIYRVDREANKIKKFINGGKVFNEPFPFPAKALAVAHLPVDKFKFSRNLDDDFYVYLGLRQATNLTTTGALEAKILQSLISQLQTEDYRVSLNCWLKYLSLDNNFGVEFDGIRRSWLEIDSARKLEKILKNSITPWARLKSSQNPRIAAYTYDDFINFIEVFNKSLKISSDLGSPRIKGFVQLSSIFNSLDQREIWETGIDVFRRLRVAQNINLLISKNQKFMNFSQLSSGEQQVLGTITRLLEFVRPGSIIVIDEPEVSLHPLWQMQYIPTLLQALRHVSGIHIIIATHSHFMVADIDSDVASLIVANDSRTFKIFDGDVYGRSPENILYRVFGVGQVSNFYVEQDLAEALRIISHRELKLDDLKNIQSRLTKLIAPDNQAFGVIMEKIDHYLNNQNQ